MDSFIFKYVLCSLFNTYSRRNIINVLDFHGFGNNTARFGSRFHEVDHEQASLEAGVGVRGDSGLELTVGLTTSRSSTSENSGRFFRDLRDNLYGAIDFWQAGATAMFVFDPPVDESQSANRIHLEIGGATFPELLDVVTPFTKASGGLSAVLAPSVSSPISLAFRVGGEKIWGDQLPWDEAAFLGGARTVRGFDQERYAGDASVFGSGELRLRLGQASVLVPVDLGVFGFADAGRVYLDGDSPGGWHTSVGGGIWLTPITQPYMLRAGFAASDEATKIYIETGLPLLGIF